MCGIVGYVGARDAVPILLDGLLRLEYRGYDSAGLAILQDGGRIAVRKRDGKIQRLRTLVAEQPVSGRLGVGHTRWATHGPPTTPNAHPHLDGSGRIALVHNGIIENHAALRDDLAARGHRFASETDSEVIAHLIEDALQRQPGGATDVAALEAAVRAALRRLEGSYALAVFSADRPGAIVAARHFSPLVVGLGPGETFLASDIPALLSETRRVLPLEDDEVAVLTADGVAVRDADGRPVEREPLTVDWSAAAAEKGGYEHYVRKEIDEQPAALAETLRGRLAGDEIRLPELDALDPGRLRRVYVVAAGTSLYAGLVFKLQLEEWAALPVEVAVASELRYGNPVLGPETLVVLISQSGETADTLAAGRLAVERLSPTLSVTNVVGSSLTRLAQRSLMLQVGPEVGVVATKTFTGQLMVLAMLAAELGRRLGRLADEDAAAVARDLRAVPAAVQRAIDEEPRVAAVARELAGSRSMFFLGRRYGYPVALEGALKLKEISYIHAEGYPAGELKHGPIAMLEPAIPVFAVATAAPTQAKVLLNVEEVRARGVRVAVLANEGDAAVRRVADYVLTVPRVREALSPMVDVVPAQLLAYHVAVALGRDVDQPRNLAKSVTVE